MDISFFFLLQAFFDVLILVFVVALYIQLKKLQRLPFQETIERLKAANELCERLTANLAEKKLISERLMSALETGAKAWEASKTDAANIKDKVRQLAKEGLSIPEIAEKTGLQEGEVALLLSVAEKS
ncbi:MAG: hypothetical protein GXO17_01485 [Thermodesulfobacteria bacterium]|nr:hypothetical protein [Thermodesulfobacteriota bacterium]